MNESAASSSASPWVIAARSETWEADVSRRSQDVLVVVDFWAPWCAPCRALGPILERLADQYAGRFVLVKANTDELPEIAARFQVQGIPAVYAVSEGQVIEFFSGALPESHVRAWLDQMLLVQEMAAARKAEEGDPADAERRYRSLVAAAPRNPDAKIGLARVLLARGCVDECETLLAELQGRGFLEPDAEKVKAALELGRKSGEDLSERRAAAQADPRNMALRLQLAEALVGARHFEEALATCLSVVECDRQGVGEQARRLMIDIFRVLPEDSALTAEYRRKLSMALF